ncbi:hypothetical protein [Polaromonas sp.]|uniref:hypothetical protein n=1 Tax=Polaromonas sp. TaxID=1869339 RepID=UPI003CBE7CEA
MTLAYLLSIQLAMPFKGNPGESASQSPKKTMLAGVSSQKFAKLLNMSCEISFCIAAIEEVCQDQPAVPKLDTVSRQSKGGTGHLSQWRSCPQSLLTNLNKVDTIAAIESEQVPSCTGV